MLDHERMFETIVNCGPDNEWADFHLFHQYARDYPARAFGLGWHKVSACPDRDDGMLICAILQILSAISQEELWSRLFKNWGELDWERRRSIISSAAECNVVVPLSMWWDKELCDKMHGSTEFNNAVLSLEQWLELFHDPRSETSDRHSIIAALSGGRYHEAFCPYVVECLETLGSYSESYRNEILAHFVGDIRRYYRLDEPKSEPG